MPSTPLTYELLREAVEGEAVALRAKTRLKPLHGVDEKVFPPTYLSGADGVHAFEERWVDDNEEPVPTVLLNSVAAQANRAEQVLLDAHDDGELVFPLPWMDLSNVQGEGTEGLRRLGRITALSISHRLADSHFQCGKIDGEDFPHHEVGHKIMMSHPNDATAMYEYCPTSLLFGQWDSHGQVRHGVGNKFQRAFVSEIVGYCALKGVKVSSRLDHADISAAAKVYKHKDPLMRATLESKDAAPKSPKKPSDLGFGNVAPEIKEEGGGVSIQYAEDMTHLSLATLRKLRFAGHKPSDDATVSARTAVAALGCAAIAYSWRAGYDLRSRCLLVPESGSDLMVEMVAPNGTATTVGAFTADAAQQVVADASQRAAADGLVWSGDLEVEPSDVVLGLLEQSIGTDKS